MNKKSAALLLLALQGLAGALDGATQPGTVLWSYDAGDFIVSSPTLVPDGTIYVATANALIAVTNNGAIASNNWSFPVQIGVSAGGAIPGSVAVGLDGVVYLGSQDGNLYAINPDGSQRWAYAAQGNSGSPAIGFDGTIYYVGFTYLHAISASGSRKWTAVLGDSGNFASPVIGSDGTIYVASEDFRGFHAFDPTGREKWGVDLTYAPGNTAALGDNGTILFTAGNLFLCSPEGSVLWQTSGIELSGSSTVVAKDGTILVPLSRGFNLYAFNGSGQYLWQNLGGASRSEPPSCPAIDSAGNIYYCVSNGVWELNSQGAVVWNLNAPGLPGAAGFFAATSPTIGPDGTIYAVLATTLYAIAGTNQLSDSSWPMLRQNPRHTGKIERPGLGKPQKRSDSGFQFQLFAGLGQTSTIQVSTDLYGWTSWTDLLVTNIPMDVVDLASTNFVNRFYRAVNP